MLSSTDSPLLLLAEPLSEESQLEGRDWSWLFNSWSRKKSRSSSPQQVTRDPLSSDTQMLTQEVRAQKVTRIKACFQVSWSCDIFFCGVNVQELVWILHKALEASQLEKRACAQFLAAEGEQERLEVLRHRERHVVQLQGRLEEARMEAEDLRTCLAQRDMKLEELEEEIKMLKEKNNAKQEVRSHDSGDLRGSPGHPIHRMDLKFSSDHVTFPCR